ncbi:MAG: hypothetical protein LBH29_02280 [Elusimicrobiota bacterium]|jgi:hypothetical protein|nr:hypothetical protein [Elusimicrobiota bacterium]
MDSGVALLIRIATPVALLIRIATPVRRNDNVFLGIDAADIVIPAKAGIHFAFAVVALKKKTA